MSVWEQLRGPLQKALINLAGGSVRAARCFAMPEYDLVAPLTPTDCPTVAAQTRPQMLLLLNTTERDMAMRIHRLPKEPASSSRYARSAYLSASSSAKNADAASSKPTEMISIGSPGVFCVLELSDDMADQVTDCIEQILCDICEQHPHLGRVVSDASTRKSSQRHTIDLELRLPDAAASAVSNSGPVFLPVEVVPAFRMTDGVTMQVHGRQQLCHEETMDIGINYSIYHHDFLPVVHCLKALLQTEAEDHNLPTPFMVYCAVQAAAEALTRQGWNAGAPLRTGAVPATDCPPTPFLSLVQASANMLRQHLAEWPTTPSGPHSTVHQASPAAVAAVEARCREIEMLGSSAELVSLLRKQLATMASSHAGRSVTDLSASDSNFCEPVAVSLAQHARSYGNTPTPVFTPTSSHICPRSMPAFSLDYFQCTRHTFHAALFPASAPREAGARALRFSASVQVPITEAVSRACMRYCGPNTDANSRQRETLQRFLEQSHNRNLLSAATHRQPATTRDNWRIPLYSFYVDLQMDLSLNISAEAARRNEELAKQHLAGDGPGKPGMALAPMPCPLPAQGTATNPASLFAQLRARGLPAVQQIFLSGPAGIGKTTLCRHIVREVQSLQGTLFNEAHMVFYLFVGTHGGVSPYPLRKGFEESRQRDLATIFRTVCLQNNWKESLDTLRTVVANSGDKVMVIVDGLMDDIEVMQHECPALARLVLDPPSNRPWWLRKARVIATVQSPRPYVRVHAETGSREVRISRTGGGMRVPVTNPAGSEAGGEPRWKWVYAPAEAQMSLTCPPSATVHVGGLTEPNMREFVIQYAKQVAQNYEPLVDKVQKLLDNHAELRELTRVPLMLMLLCDMQLRPSSHRRGAAYGFSLTIFSNSPNLHHRLLHAFMEVGSAKAIAAAERAQGPKQFVLYGPPDGRSDQEVDAERRQIDADMCLLARVAWQLLEANGDDPSAVRTALATLDRSTSVRLQNAGLLLRSQPDAGLFCDSDVLALAPAATAAGVSPLEIIHPMLLDMLLAQHLGTLRGRQELTSSRLAFILERKPTLMRYMAAQLGGQVAGLLEHFVSMAQPSLVRVTTPPRRGARTGAVCQPGFEMQAMQLMLGEGGGDNTQPLLTSLHSANVDDSLEIEQRRQQYALLALDYAVNCGAIERNDVRQAIYPLFSGGTMQLAHCGLGPANMPMVARLLKCQLWPRLSAIRLDGNALGSKGILALAESLPLAVHVRELKLSNTNLSGAGTMTALVRAVVRCPRLESLDLSDNPLDRSDGPGDGFSSGPAEACCKALVNIWLGYPSRTLEHLDLSGCGLNDACVWQLVKMLFGSHRRKLRELHLQRNNITDEGASGLALALEQVTVVPMVDPSRMTNAEMDEMENAARRERLLLHLGNNSIGDEGARLLAQSLSRMLGLRPRCVLQALADEDEGGIGASDQDGGDGPAGNERAKACLGLALDLSGNRIGSEGAVELLKVLLGQELRTPQQPTRVLRGIVLTGNPALGQSAAESMCAHLGQWIDEVEQGLAIRKSRRGQRPRLFAYDGRNAGLLQLESAAAFQREMERYDRLRERDQRRERQRRQLMRAGEGDAARAVAGGGSSEKGWQPRFCMRRLLFSDGEPLEQAALDEATSRRSLKETLDRLQQTLARAAMEIRAVGPGGTVEARHSCSFRARLNNFGLVGGLLALNV